MKSLSLVALGIAIAAFNSHVNAQTNDIIFSELKPSDKPIVIDIARNRLPKGDGGSTCPDTQLCQYVLDGWITGLREEPQGQKYLQALESKPPHIKNQTLTADFSKRYEQISNLKNSTLCFDDDGWKMYNDRSGYYFGQEQNFAGDLTVFYNNLPSLANVVLRDNQKLLQKIPNEYITDDVFKKISSLGNERFIRICGKLTSAFVSEKYRKRKLQPHEIGVEPALYEFTVEKPIEFYKKGDKKPTLTIPLSWYK